MKVPMTTAFVSSAGGAEESAGGTAAHEAAGTAANEAPGTASRASLALARLHATRQALRLELLPPPEAQDSTDPASAPASQSLHRMWRRLRRWARNSAPVSVLVQALEQTWRLHPLRPVGEAIVEGYRSQVAPTLRKHPWALVALAAGLGAALVLGRRWHGPLLANTLRPLPQRLGRWLLSQLASAPVQTALAGWLMIRAASAKPAADSPASEDEAPVAADPAEGQGRA